MKIDSYSISQNSAHSLTSEQSVSENLEAWIGAPPQEGEENRAFVVDIKSQDFEFSTEKTYLNPKKPDLCEGEVDPRIKLIESLVYYLTGKRMRFRDKAAELLKKTCNAPNITIDLTQGSAPAWGLRYDYSEIVSEQESVTFNASGQVKTADGRTFSFDVNFSMSRQFYQQTSLSLRLGNAVQAVDPLVVVLDGGTPTLSTTKHAFDLDSDGKTENISFATGNSGFLAYDKNGDGIINDGSELFGPQSGNGFEELRAYDTDKNGWIDEVDEIFGKLSVLVMQQDGSKTLFKLGDVGIGAIYLEDISTQFAIKDMQNTYGEMKSSSIFLKENGKTGTIHHIDLVI